MMRRLGRWLVETRPGRFTFRAVAVLFVLGGAYAVIHVEVGRQTGDITNRVEVIERVRPVDVIRQCLRAPRCRGLLEDPSSAPSRSLVKPDGGDALQSPTSGDQPSEPGVRPGGQVDKGQKGKPDRPRPPKPQAPTEPEGPPGPVTPSSPATSSAPTPSEPQPEPGNSGGGESADNGVKACVDLVVSACVNAGLPDPP